MAYKKRAYKTRRIKTERINWFLYRFVINVEGQTPEDNYVQAVKVEGVISKEKIHLSNILNVMKIK